MTSYVFRDRKDAGQLLGGRLALRGYARPIVLALAPGGIAVAWPIAHALHAPLDVLLVRGCADAERPEPETDATRGRAAAGARIDGEDVASTPREAEREAQYRDDRAPLALPGRTVILVDDGSATGETLRTALATLRRQNPKRIVVAVPIAPRDETYGIAHEAEELVRLATPAASVAVSELYEDFRGVTDEEALELLKRAAGTGSEP